MTASRWIGAALLTALLAVGCGYDEPDGYTQPAAAAPTTTSTTVPPGGRQPTAATPLRVIFAGDSVMSELAPAAIDTLNRGGATEAKFVLSPGVSLDATDRVLWDQQLDTFDPEVIVVLVGTWETGDALGEPGTPGWRARYDREVLDPFVALATSRGAELVWVGMPAVADAASTFILADLNAAYADLPTRYQSVHYIPGGEYLSAPTGGFAEFLESDQGLVRVRRTDGLHLCPDGAQLLAEPVIEALVERWNIPVAEDWRSGDWRRPPIFVKPEECPPSVSSLASASGGSS